mgnify:CR=1 FL=1
MVFLFNILSFLVSTAISLFVVLVVEFITWKHPQEQPAVEQRETNINNSNTTVAAPNQQDNARGQEEHLADGSGLSVLHSCDKIINIIRIPLIILKMLAQALLTIRFLLPWFADTMDYHFFKTGWNVSIYVSFSVIIWEYLFLKDTFSCGPI